MMAARAFADRQAFYDYLDSVPGRLDRRGAYAGGNWAALYDAALQALIDDEHLRSQALSPDDQVELQRWVIHALVCDVPMAAVRAAALVADAQCAERAESDDRIMLPRRLVETLLFEVLQPALPRLRTNSGRGRLARWVRQYRHDVIDFERYCQVWFRKLHHDGRSFSRSKERMTRSWYHREIRVREAVRGVALRYPTHIICCDERVSYPWTAGASDEFDVFDAASLVLRGGFAAGGPRAIRDSYARVTERLRSGQGWRYYPSRWIRLKGQPRSAEADYVR